jgi:hypothetical protein
MNPEMWLFIGKKVTVFACELELLEPSQVLNDD